MPRKPKAPPAPLLSEADERAFEEVLKANDEIAEEGEALKPQQTHRYRKGRPARERFSMF